MTQSAVNVCPHLNEQTLECAWLRDAPYPKTSHQCREIFSTRNCFPELCPINRAQAAEKRVAALASWIEEALGHTEGAMGALDQVKSDLEKAKEGE